MKKFTLSIVAVMAMSTFAIAGGDIAPVEEPVVVVEPVVDDSGFYLGLAYGMGDWDWDQEHGNYDESYDFNTVMLQAGYNFNKYIAVEGRYWFGLDTSNSHENEDFDLNVAAWGIYVKPQYPITEAFKVYGLLGYVSISKLEGSNDSNGAPDVDLTDNFDFDGFSWGLGAAYTITDNVEVFVDYVSMYDDTIDMNTNDPYDADFTTWNFGITYKF